MSSRFYLSLVAFAVAGALFSLGILFGLGVLTAPPKIDANTPSQYAVRTKGAAHEATPVTDGQALTPVYPASPGGAQNPAPAEAEHAQASAKEPPKTVPTNEVSSRQETSGASPRGEAQAETQAEAQAPRDKPPPPPNKTVASAAPASATPVSAPSANRCDVAACAAAYKSFRESDCTYQPYDGPRQLCVKPPTPAQQQAARPPERKARAAVVDGHRDDSDLRGAVEAVQRLTRDRDFEALPPPDGRAIVIERW
jgi:hypothetical protein